jgi:IclR family mhp operon transcriptional activator
MKRTDEKPGPRAAPDRPRPINVVVRAFAVLKAMNLAPVSTLDMLHRETRIPKPTLSRLLQTMEAVGLINHARYGAYYLTSDVATLSHGYHGEPRIVEASRSFADAVTLDVKWPVAIATPAHDSMITCYTTTTLSPLSIFHSPVGMRISYVHMALGRAYLAFCGADVQSTVIELLRVLGQPIDGPLGADLMRTLARVREQGYALRDPRIRPETMTIAVPIFEGKRVVASMGLTWFSKVIKPQEAVDRFLPLLLDATGQIGAQLARTP